jgi:polyvinyl alcohol dehydrogenase (cytochrome)
MFSKNRVLRLCLAGGAALILGFSLAGGAKAATSTNWSTYLNNSSRTGFASAETLITPSTVPGLHPLWTDSSSAVSAEPVEVNGTVYYGSWDGYEHAVDAATGTQLWATYLGQTSKSTCNPPTVGVASTATVGTIPVNGVSTQAVFVGGGDHNFYALNAATGAVIWKSALGTTASTFLWSSPLFYHGTIYEGVSSFGDCPLVRGKMVAMRATTGGIRHTLYTAPSGCTGASVWGSPALDTSTGDVYFTTGNSNSTCASIEPLSVAVIQASSSLSLLSSWQIPSADHGPDSDFGSTPTLFTSAGVPMVGVQNKNGVYYAFDRSSLSGGPAWRTRIAKAGECPECGTGNISSSAWDGNYLYVGGGTTTVNGVSCKGSVQALQPGTGNIIWQDCLQGGPVLGAISAVPGVVFLGQGTYFMALDAGTGNTLFSYQDSNSGSDFWGPASISNGVAYIGNQDGTLFAFGP